MSEFRVSRKGELYSLWILTFVLKYLFFWFDICNKMFVPLSSRHYNLDNLLLAFIYYTLNLSLISWRYIFKDSTRLMAATMFRWLQDHGLFSFKNVSQKTYQEQCFQVLHYLTQIFYLSSSIWFSWNLPAYQWQYTTSKLDQNIIFS